MRIIQYIRKGRRYEEHFLVVAQIINSSAYKVIKHSYDKITHFKNT